ncbi:MAG: LPS export ABC transporter periplasmic protein LptC [Saprospiraceae bacterium]
MKFTTLLLLCLSSLLLFVACENDLAAVQKVLSQEAMTTEVIKDFQTFYSDSAVVRVKVSGPVMVRHLDRKNPHQEFVDGLQIDFFDGQENVRGKLTANYGIRYENKKEFVMQDSVVWKSKRGETLETEELIWDDRKQKVFSNKFVEITKPGEKIYGYGFETDKDFSRWKIKQVEGVIKVDGISKELEGNSASGKSVTKPTLQKNKPARDLPKKPTAPATTTGQSKPTQGN